MQVRKILGANVYINGNNLLGQADEVTPPSIKLKMEEHKALGQFIGTEFPTGIEKLEATFKFNSYYPEILKTSPLKTVDLQVRANQAIYEGDTISSEIEVVHYIRGIFKETNFDAIKQGEQSGVEKQMSVTYSKLVIAGETIHELDAVNNIYKVGGEDVLASYKNNIGA
nr:phage major tail tube protein [bacterium]